MFLSFVVPVYNTEEFLAECLDSLLNQDISVDDYEIICVNDGSTDGSLSVLRRYEEDNANIRIIDKENGGVASARNAGLDAAKGEYVWFLDSDDVIKPRFLWELKTHIEKMHPDRVKIGAYVFSGDASSYTENAELKVNAHFYDSSVCASVLSKRFLNLYSCRFHYPQLAYGEDSIFMFEMVAHNPRCTEIDNPIYFYRNRPGSAMTSTSEIALEKKLKSHFLAAKIMKQHFENNVGNARDAANLLMEYIWYTMSECALLPRGRRKRIVVEMQDVGLFPFQRPDACTHVRSYQTTRTDLIGRIFDWIYMHTHTEFGFLLMCLWSRAYSAYKTLRK